MKPTNLQEIADEIHETINPTSRIGMQVATILAHAEAWKRAGDAALSQLAALHKSTGNDIQHEAIAAHLERLRTM
jgi:hypothetical protein